MPNRHSLSLFLVIVALVCLGWAIKSPAAITEPPPAQAVPAARCSQALANKNGAPVAKHVQLSAQAGQRLCASALRHRAASPS